MPDGASRVKSSERLASSEREVPLFRLCHGGCDVQFWGQSATSGQNTCFCHASILQNQLLNLRNLRNHSIGFFDHCLKCMEASHRRPSGYVGFSEPFLSPVHICLVRVFKYLLGNTQRNPPIVEHGHRRTVSVDRSAGCSHNATRQRRCQHENDQKHCVKNPLFRRANRSS